YPTLRADPALRQVRAQPALDLADRLALAGGVVLELVVADPADGEVPGPRVGEVDAAHGGGGGHREALGQLDPEPARIEQVEELRLLAVVRAGRVPERRPDAAVALGDERARVEALVRRIPLAPRAFVEPLGERLREPIGERLDDDRLVVVVR